MLAVALLAFVGAQTGLSWAAGGTRDMDTVEPKATVTKTVVMKGDYFNPKTITISKGTKVKWVNKGQAAHTTTGPGWDKALSPGQSYAKTFKKTGTFKYYCKYHENMKGTVKVTG